MEPDTIKKQKTSWHRLLARLLELVLSPVNIEVLSDVSVMTEPPEADILLLRRQTAQWTAAQRALLPDGIRNSKASHILIEFKYTESFNENALQQAVGYDFFYKRAKKLADEELQTVLLSAKKPQSDTLTDSDYHPTEYPGVYQTQHFVIRKVLLLSLNELSDEPHNAWIKCFASRKTVKEQALKRLKEFGLDFFNHDLECLLMGLLDIWFSTPEGEEMEMKPPTPEQVIEMGKIWGDVFIANLTIEDVLARFESKEVLSHFKPVDRLVGLKPPERLVGLTPSERLAGLKQAEIEDYLKQLKKQEH